MKCDLVVPRKQIQEGDDLTPTKVLAELLGTWWNEGIPKGDGVGFLRIVDQTEATVLFLNQEPVVAVGPVSVLNDPTLLTLFQQFNDLVHQGLRDRNALGLPGAVRDRLDDLWRNHSRLDPPTL